MISRLDRTWGYDIYSDFVSSRRETYERNNLNNYRRKVSINNAYSGLLFFPVSLTLTARRSRTLVRSPLRTVIRVETTVTEQNSINLVLWPNLRPQFTGTINVSDKIVEGQLSRATVWGINYPVLTSGRIRLIRTHADYTVLFVVHRPFVSRDAFNQSGRMHVIRL